MGSEMCIRDSYDPDSDDYLYFEADMHDDMKSLLAKLKKQK